MLKIGEHVLSSPFILAPMAGVSEKPYRCLARQMGAAAAPTELVSALGLVHGQARTERYMRHDSALEQPFWVQIFGGEPAAMAAGARRAVALGAKIIDINMGCPVRKVTRNGAGSALLCDPARAAAVVEAVGAAGGVPVTVKIRAGWDHDHLNYRQMGQVLEAAGASAIALHARTRAQGYTGAADWRMIGELAAACRIPVIGNGDVRSVADAQRMLATTGCQGVMIGRAALGNPWLFRQLVGGDGLAPSPRERWSLVEAHLEAHLAFVGDPVQGIRRFRSHLMWYAHGLRGAAAFRHEVAGLAEVPQVRALAAAFFQGALAADQAGEVPFDARTALG